MRTADSDPSHADRHAKASVALRTKQNDLAILDLSGIRPESGSCLPGAASWPAALRTAETCALESLRTAKACPLRSFLTGPAEA